MTALVVLGCIFGYVVIGSSIGFRLRYKGVACERIFGFRMRRAERAARRIADLAREIYGGIR